MLWMSSSLLLLRVGVWRDASMSRRVVRGVVVGLMEMEMEMMGSSLLRIDPVGCTVSGGERDGVGCVCGCVCLPLFCFVFWCNSDSFFVPGFVSLCMSGDVIHRE
jgi:hypothetical protein